MEDICMILRESYIDIWYIGVISGILPANNVRTVAKFRNMTKKGDIQINIKNGNIHINTCT